jgi:hypothetical protein
MTRDVDELLASYRKWLREKTATKEVGGWVQITTPYLDRHNDCLQIYAQRQDGSWILSDDAYTIADLESSGMTVSSSDTRRRLFDMTLNGFGVRRGANDELFVVANDANFGLKKHNLIQAMLAIGDMFYLSRPTVQSIFFEDVRRWMDEHEIRYTPSVKLTGKSGYDHYIDFIIPRSDRQPERLIQLMNNPSKDRTEAVCFSWIEIKDTRPAETTAYAIINDNMRDVPATINEALSAYNIRPVLFSRRAGVQAELAA